MLVTGIPELLRIFIVIVPCSACVQLRRLALSEAVASSVRPLSRINGVANTTSCVQLCVQDEFCSASRFYDATKTCKLLTSRFDFLEGDTAMADIRGEVEVWAIVGRGFGECPSSYRLSWRTSRYRLYKEKLKWFDADRQCRREGSKLAEVTSDGEASALVQQIQTVELIYALVGALQKPGAEEPKGGWYWFRSGLPIFETNADNYRGIDDAGIAWIRSHSFILGDVSRFNSYSFLCECHEFK